MNNDLPPLWALDVAAKRIGYTNWAVVRQISKAHVGYIATVELARTIAQYEQPPSDPDEEALARVLNAGNAFPLGVQELRCKPDWELRLAQFKRELEARK